MKDIVNVSENVSENVLGSEGVKAVPRLRPRPRPLFICTALILAACSEDPAPIEPGGPGYVEVDSDPRGAAIFVDGQDRRRVTPDTLHGISGSHEISVRRDSAGGTYGFRVQLRFSQDSVTHITGPLTLPRCSGACPLVMEHTASRIRFGRTPTGPLFYRDGTGDGAFWPSTTSNGYTSTGIPVFAALLEGQAPVALGIYDYNYVAGRPFPTVSNSAGAFSLKQSFWVIPPVNALDLPTARGIEVSEEVIGRPGVDDVLVLRLVFRNVTNQPAYRASDPYAPPGGFRFQDAFVGFALDPDIGTAEDDLFTYDPELNAVIAYDAAFREDIFQGTAASAPGLVGLRMLESPAGARRVLNGWPRSVAAGPGDWSAGTATESNGFVILSGANAYAPDHADNTIGHLPGTGPNDHRISVSAGPVNLAAGDSVVIRVAIAFADPAAGTFTSGTIVDSGDPAAGTRTIMQIAAPLRARLRAAETVR